MYKAIFLETYTTPDYHAAIKSLIGYLQQGKALSIVDVCTNEDGAIAYLIKCANEESSDMFDTLSTCDAIPCTQYTDLVTARDTLKADGYTIDVNASPLYERVSRILKSREIDAPVEEVIKHLPDSANELDDEALDTCITVAISFV